MRGHTSRAPVDFVHTTHAASVASEKTLKKVKIPRDQQYSLIKGNRSSVVVGRHELRTAFREYTSKFLIGFKGDPHAKSV